MKFFSRLEQGDFCPRLGSYCLIYKGLQNKTRKSIRKNGRPVYPICKFRGGLWRTNRVSYTLAYGEIPEGMFVLHQCDNPLCSNPEHLTLGDNQQNMKEASERNRLVRKWRSLSPTQVRLIRSLTPSMSQRKIASVLGVSRSQVRIVLSGQGYQDIL